MDKTTEIMIYGVSDDLVAVDGDIDGADEYDSSDLTGILSYQGESLQVRAVFGARGGMDWQITVAAVRSYPDWVIQFTERPDYEGDPAVRIRVPVGTTFSAIEPK